MTFRNQFACVSFEKTDFEEGTAHGPGIAYCAHGQLTPFKMENALNRSVDIARQFDNQAILELGTRAYFMALPPPVAVEESHLEEALSAATRAVDFDQPQSVCRDRFSVSDYTEPAAKGDRQRYRGHYLGRLARSV